MYRKLHIIYNKRTMQWCVKLGRITVFASDCYDIAEDFKLQYEEDKYADRKEMMKRKAGENE